jgi:hypothetical protein
MSEPVPSDVVVPFPFEKRVEPVPNDARMEWMFSALEPHEPASKKRLILQARQEHVGIIDDQQASILIGALGLKEA